MSRKSGIIAELPTLAAVALTPFWFLHPGGINLGVVDVLFVVAAGILVVRDRRLIVFPSRWIGIGACTFLAGAAISLAVTPRPVEGLLDFVQYGLIFGVIVPVTVTVFRDRRRRWQAILLLWIGLNFIAIAALVNLPGSSLNDIKHMKLWFGNQNQLYWLISAGAITNLGFVLDDGMKLRIRYLSGILLLLSIGLVVIGRSLSAILMVAVGGWLFLFVYLLHKRNRTVLDIFLVLSIIGTAVGLAVVIYNWDYFYRLGNVDKRLYMYREAIRIGTATLPFGTGLESSPVVLAHFPPDVATSIHNFMLAYYLEIGILGTIGFGTIIIQWVREACLGQMRYLSRVASVELVPALVFFGFLAAMLFQNVIVHRFWWVMFGLSWTPLLGARVGQPDTSSL